MDGVLGKRDVFAFVEHGAHRFCGLRGPGTVLDQSDLSVLKVSFFELFNELTHEREDVRIVSCRREHEFSISEGVFDGFRHVGTREVVKYGLGASVLFQNFREKIDRWLNRLPSPLQNSSLSMDMVAQQMDIDRQWLSDYIYVSQRSTFSAWLSDLRVRECRRRLLETDDTLSEIAYQCGYADLPTMSKAFKRKFAISPSYYRNHHSLAQQRL